MKRVLAAFMFFTRLPLWRMVEVPSHYFKRVVELWPLTGWLTGGVMALTMWLSAQILPATVAALMAIAARLILTGALHDDGLADFCDGFGGGTSRERILAIMKDSHIGTYGVISLIIYYTLFVTLISSLPLHLACMTLIAGDVWSKFCASQVINLLPYARKEEESKAHTIYNRIFSPPLSTAHGLFHDDSENRKRLRRIFSSCSGSECRLKFCICSDMVILLSIREYS